MIAKLIKKVPKSIMITSTLILTLIVGTVTINAFKNNGNKPVVVFKEDIVLEYGDEIRSDDIVDLFIDTETSVFKTLEFLKAEIDTFVVGDNHSTVLEYSLNGLRTQSEFVYSVEDTNSPILDNVSDIVVRYKEGEEILVDLVGDATASDVVDGSLEVKIDDSKLDLNKDGVYEVVAFAEDKNGNITREPFNVTVEIEVVDLKNLPNTGNESTQQNTSKKPVASTPSGSSKPTQPSKPDDKEAPSTKEPDPINGDNCSWYDCPPEEEFEAGGWTYYLYKEYDTFRACMNAIEEWQNTDHSPWKSTLCLDTALYYVLRSEN